MLTKEAVLRQQEKNTKTVRDEIELAIDRKLVTSLEFPVIVDLSRFPAALGDEVAKDYATKGNFDLEIVGFIAHFS